ncbi:hypothetical protein QL285_066827 [Trifolium repens]|nr:hypothetical protein QL285_066827 [Trifolium repens]
MWWFLGIGLQKIWFERWEVVIGLTFGTIVGLGRSNQRTISSLPPFPSARRRTNHPSIVRRFFHSLFHLAVNDSLLFAVNHLLPFSLLFLRLSSIVQSPFLRFPSVNRSVRVKQSPFKSFGSIPLRRKHCIQVILLCFSPAFLIATFGAISLCVLRHRHIADIDTIRSIIEG